MIAGLALAFSVVRTLEAMLFGLSPGAPVTFLQVTAAVTVGALLAAGIPSLRAVRARHVNIHKE